MSVAEPLTRRIALHRYAAIISVLCACEFSPLDPPADFRTGVYAVSVTVDDGCGQIDVPNEPLNCRAGLDLADDGALLVAWPEVDRATYIVHDGALTNVAEAPVLRWSTSGTEPSTVCDGAALRWIVSLSNDGVGALSGSLRNSWTGVDGCPVTVAMPTAECNTVFAYRYTLEESCEAPCTLENEDTAPAPGEPYDCGLTRCVCP